MYSLIGTVDQELGEKENKMVKKLYAQSSKHIATCQQEMLHAASKQYGIQQLMRMVNDILIPTKKRELVDEMLVTNASLNDMILMRNVTWQIPTTLETTRKPSYLHIILSDEKLRSELSCPESKANEVGDISVKMYSCAYVTLPGQLSEEKVMIHCNPYGLVNANASFRIQRTMPKLSYILVNAAEGESYVCLVAGILRISWRDSFQWSIMVAPMEQVKK